MHLWQKEGYSVDDTKKTVHELKLLINEFIAERDWHQFHNPKNLSMNISVEAAELMEKFLWVSTEKAFDEAEKYRQDVHDELADIFLGVITFANACNIDLSSALMHKLEIAKKKYPVEKSKGKYTKYTEL